MPWKLQGGNAYQTVEGWDDLIDLEPAAEGTYAIVTGGVDGATLSGDCLVRRGATAWGLPSSDSTARAYMAAHPIPNLSPKADYTYILPSSGFYTFDDFPVTDSVKSYRLRLHPNGPANTFTAAQIGLANHLTSSYTVNRVYLMRSDNTNPAVTENSATGLVTVVGSPITIPAGSDASPSWTWLTSTAMGTISQLDLLIEVAAGAPLASWGDYGWEGIGWTATLQEVLSTNLSSSINFSGSNSYGMHPLIACKFTGLATPVCWLPFVGDSWPDGYGDGPGPRRPVGIAGRLNARWSAASQPIAPMMFARSGFTTTQSVTRLQNLLANFDVRAAAVQFNSLNNVIQELSNTQCQTDWIAVEDAMGSRKLAPFVGGCMLTWPSGAFSAWKANSDWMVARNALTNVDIYDTCVSPTTGEFGVGLYFTGEPNPSHLNQAGHTQWEADSHANFRAVLAGWGV
jgi:hypothetical protein